MSKPLTIYDLYLTSDSMEKEGIVLKYGQAEFIVARAGGKNTKFVESRDKYLKLFKDNDDEAGKEFLASVWADGVIRGWNNVTDKEGNPLPFNFENCKRVLLDLPDLFDDIRRQSQRFSLFLEMKVEQAEKNS